MPKAPRAQKPKLPTAQQSLAQIAESLGKIACILEASFLDLNGNCLLENISSALFDVAQYGPGQAPKDRYAWRK